MNKNAPEISVIVPAYNTGKFIPQCMDSILAQTFDNFEVICVNDGSPDNALEVFNDFSARDKRVRVIDQPNQGVVYAKNNGIAASRGKYIVCLDSDDYVAPEFLERLYNTITTTDYSVVCCNGRKFGLKNKDWYLGNGLVKKLSMYTFHNSVHNSALFPRELWEKYGGYCKELNSLVGEDYEFWLNFLDDDKKIAHVPDKLFFYRMVENSRSTKSKNNVAKQSRKITRRRHPRIYFYTVVRFFVRPFIKLGWI